MLIRLESDILCFVSDKGINLMTTRVCCSIAGPPEQQVCILKGCFFGNKLERGQMEPY